MALPLPLPPPTRPKAGVRTPLFLLGVGMALLAFVGMFAFGIVFANRGLAGGGGPGVLAAGGIPAREPITPAQPALGPVPRACLQPQPFSPLHSRRVASPPGAQYKV